MDKGASSPADFSRERYAALLAEVAPVFIDTEEEHERMLSAAESVLEKGEGMTLEEKKLAKLLVLLIETYEQQDEDEDEEDSEPATLPSPHETLNRLLTARGLEPTDIAHFFGNLALTEQALAGKREFSRRQVKDLAKFFSVPEGIFLSSRAGRGQR
jgi:HTH-type transcriptional regulator / antitoxin HigA